MQLITNLPVNVIVPDGKHVVLLTTDEFTLRSTWQVVGFETKSWYSLRDANQQKIKSLAGVI